MDFVNNILLVFHLLGLATLVGGWLASFKTPTVTGWQLTGAIVQVVTGLGMVGVLESQGGSISHLFVGVKLVLGIIILITAIVGYSKRNKDQPVPTGLAHATGGLALITVFVGVLMSTN